MIIPDVITIYPTADWKRCIYVSSADVLFHHLHPACALLRVVQWFILYIHIAATVIIIIIIIIIVRTICIGSYCDAIVLKRWTSLPRLIATDCQDMFGAFSCYDACMCNHVMTSTIFFERVKGYADHIADRLLCLVVSMKTTQEVLLAQMSISIMVGFEFLSLPTCHWVVLVQLSQSIFFS